MLLYAVSRSSSSVKCKMICLYKLLKTLLQLQGGCGQKKNCEGKYLNKHVEVLKKEVNYGRFCDYIRFDILCHFTKKVHWYREAS